MWVIEFFHVLIGTLWMGLLYFFNLIQVQSMPKMTEEGAAKAYTQIILPKALFFFRHADPEPRQEMITALADALAHVLHTRDGSMVAVHCL